MTKEKNQGNNYKSQHQLKYLKWRMDKNPSWLEKIPDNESNKSRLCVILASILADRELISQCRITLSVYNYLLGSDILLGNNDYE